MARKTAVPSEQLDRLKELYHQEREALIALASAEEVVGCAEQDVAVAQAALKEAQAAVDVVYQALARLVGPALAAELTGRRKTGKRASRPAAPRARGEEESRGERHQATQPIMAGAASHDVLA